MSDDGKKPVESSDSIFVTDTLPDGRKVALQPGDDGTVRARLFREVKSGEAVPPGAETYYGEGHGVYERIHLDGRGATGPAQVATKKYRDGWESTFGEKKFDRELN